MHAESDRTRAVCGRVAFAWAAVVAWAAVIFFMSAHTGSELSGGTGFVAQVKQWLVAVQESVFGPGVDVSAQAAHFSEYAVFGALICVAASQHMPVRRALAFAVLAASLYGVTDELHQLFVPGRACDPVDWLVDTVGAAVGALATSALISHRRRSRARAYDAG